MRAIAQHHQPPRMLYDLALVECTRHVEAIIAVDHSLDSAIFAATAEQHDRVATPRSHAAIVPISGGGRRKARFCVRAAGSGAADKTFSLVGAEPPNRVIILQFANMDAVRQWRKQGEEDMENTVGAKYATFRIYAVEGVAQ